MNLTVTSKLVNIKDICYAIFITAQKLACTLYDMAHLHFIQNIHQSNFFQAQNQASQREEEVPQRQRKLLLYYCTIKSRKTINISFIFCWVFLIDTIIIDKEYCTGWKCCSCRVSVMCGMHVLRSVYVFWSSLDLEWTSLQPDRESLSCVPCLVQLARA